MAQYVELPDGSYAEFPDDMPDDQIARAVGGFKESPAAPSAPQPTRGATLKRTMGQMGKESTGKNLESAIAHWASKAVRGVGTTLLPEAAEKWAEKKGTLPTAEDVAILEEGRNAGIPGQAMGIALDVGTAAIPGGQAVKGAQGLRQILPRAMAAEAALGGTLAEKGRVAEEAALAGAGAGAGGLAGPVLARTLAGPIKAAKGYLPLKQAGVRQTLGQAADKGFTGEMLRTGESWLEELPFGGYFMRKNINRAGEDLTDAAAKIASRGRGVTPVAEMPNRAAAVQKLEDASNAAMTAADRVTVPIHGEAKSYIRNMADGVAKKHELDADEVMEVNKVLDKYIFNRIGTGPKGGPKKTIESGFIKDALESLETFIKGENPRLKKAALELKQELREGLEGALGKKGVDVEDLRRSRMDINALRRAPKNLTRRAVSGEDLQRGITANADRYGKGASQELQDLAENAANIDYSTIPARSSLRRWMGGMGEAALTSLSGGLASVGGLAYGKLAGNPRFVDLLINDPALQQRLIQQLRTPAISAGTALTEEYGD